GGGILFGWLADCYGRKPALQWSIFTYSAGTGLSGLAPGVGTLLVARVVTGIGVGGQWAVGQPLLAESVPPEARGRFRAALQAGARVGVGLAAIVGSFVAPVIGWRATFVLSVAPALLVTITRRALPESEVWLRNRAPPPPVRELFAPGLRRTVGLAFGLALLNMSPYWFTYTWLPTYLTPNRGLTTAASGLKAPSAWCGELPGSPSFGFVPARFARKP